MRVQELFERYYKGLDKDRAWAMINRYCKDAVEYMNEPIVRGDSSSEPYHIVQGNLGNRGSKHTTNHYTVLLDHFLGKHGYPLRSKSIICANYAGRGYASGYGTNLFAIIPFDGVSIGVCSRHDIWATDVTIPDFDFDIRIEEINNIFFSAGVSDKNFEALVKDLTVVKDRPSTEEFPISARTRAIFNACKKYGVVETLEKMYSPRLLGMQLATTKTRDVYEDGVVRELWIGGKCVTIRVDGAKELSQLSQRFKD